MQSLDVIEGKDKGRTKSIKRILGRRTRTFEACYSKASKNTSELEGDIAIRFTIEDSGAVTISRLTKNDLDAEVGVCMLEAAKRIIFPSLTGGKMILDATLHAEPCS